MYLEYLKCGIRSPGWSLALLTSWVTVHKSVNLTELQFAYLYIGASEVLSSSFGSYDNQRE